MTVNLRKGEKVSLKKTSENHLNHVFMGLGWSANKPGLFATLLGRNKEIDLDASCLMLNADATLADLVFYNHLKSRDGSIFHSGDNRTGSDIGGDDEVIHVNLDEIPSSVRYLVFTVTSYSGQNFNQIQNAYCRLVDDKGLELLRFNISGGGTHTALLMSILYRKDGEWKFKAVGDPFMFKDPVHMAPICILEALKMELD